MPAARGRLPAIALRATDGASVDVSRLDGTNVMLFVSDVSASPVAFWRGDYVARRRAGLDRVIGISAQPVEDLAALRIRLDLPFHFLSDPGDRLARALGLDRRPAIAILRRGRVEAVFRSCPDALAHLALELSHVA